MEMAEAISEAQEPWTGRNWTRNMTWSHSILAFIIGILIYDDDPYSPIH